MAGTRLEAREFKAIGDLTYRISEFNQTPEKGGSWDRDTTTLDAAAGGVTLRVDSANQPL